MNRLLTDDSSITGKIYLDFILYATARFIVRLWENKRS